MIEFAFIILPLRVEKKLSLEASLGADEVGRERSEKDEKIKRPAYERGGACNFGASHM